MENNKRESFIEEFMAKLEQIKLELKEKYEVEEENDEDSPNASI
jgi:hypothetical protein